jgi:hypothetical protein
MIGTCSTTIRSSGSSRFKIAMPSSCASAAGNLRSKLPAQAEPCHSVS